MKTERFDLTEEPEGFTWFNRPKNFNYRKGLEIIPEAGTDFWQRTHYGFRKDDGHALLRRITGDFTLTAKGSYEPEAQYDQFGLFARIDAANWVKTSIEFEGDEPSRLGSVVTDLGYSDWASQDVSNKIRSMSYRLSRRGSDVLIEYSSDDTVWNQMRITHLHATPEEIEAGIYACCPRGNGFRCLFSSIEIRDCIWKSPPG